MPWTSYGYEVQLTPLQTLAFYNAVANDGVYLEPHILSQVRDNSRVIKEVKPKSKGKIASDRSIRIVQDLLKHVVDDRDGTAHRACYDENLRIAGKTGTAQYNYGRGEPMQYMVSFAGYFPYDAPEYSIVVCIYRPKGYGLSGGVISAPVAKQIAWDMYSSTPKEVYVYDGPKSGEYSSLEKAPEIDARPGKMPSVKGLYASDAVAALEKMGLKVEISGGVGRITHQSLSPGSIFKEGQKVILTVRK